MATIGTGRYELGTEIARGAIGVVVRGVDTSTGEPVAVKRLRPETASHQESMIGFLREAEILAHLRHPAIVRLRELLSEPDGYALVLDYVDGQDLRRRVRGGGPLAPGVAVQAVATVADALAYLHSQGYLHGDIKPGNIVVPVDGTPVRLVDFGVARRVGEAGQTTYATPEYVAPEVVLGNAPGPATDVYALGMVLYELCAGRSAYRGGSSEDVLRRHLTCLPVPPPGFAETLWPVVQECLDFDPARRPTATALHARLGGLVTGLSGLVASPPLAADAVTWWLRGADETAPVLGLQRVAWVPAARQNPEPAAPERLVAVPMPDRDAEPPTNINLAAAPLPAQPVSPVFGAPPVGRGPIRPPATTLQPAGFPGGAQSAGSGPYAAGRGSVSAPSAPDFGYAEAGSGPTPPRKSRAPLLIGVAVAVVVLLSLLGVGALALTGAFSGNGPVAGPSSSPSTSTSAAPSPSSSRSTSPAPVTPTPSASAPDSGSPQPGTPPPSSGQPVPTPSLSGSLIGKPLPTFP